VTSTIASTTAWTAPGPTNPQQPLRRTTRDPRTDKQMSIAGVGYAAFWIVVIGARLIFAYEPTTRNHSYSQALGHWMTTNSVTVDGLTDALILFAIGMMLARAVSFAHVLSKTRTMATGRRHSRPVPGRRITPIQPRRCCRRQKNKRRPPPPPTASIMQRSRRSSSSARHRLVIAVLPDDDHQPSDV
jgi:hypothetical protein